MPQYAAPPPPLALAIHNAAQKYDVPEDVLTGIWRVESGSNYPNPYVNSIGYGGLFGTKDWNDPTQAQADTAASILHNLIVQDKGNVADALHSYSGGGYSSVPGETTTYVNPGSDASVAATWNAQKGGNLNTQLVGNAASSVGNAVSGAVSGIASGAESLVLRGLFMLVGLGVALVGLYLIARAMGISPPLPMPGAVKGLGQSAPQAPPQAPRRAGDAAIARGEPVTRTGPPERRTRADKRQAGRNAAARERASRERTAARDRAFGGDDDIPF